MSDEHMHEPHSRRPMQCRLCKREFKCRWRAQWETGPDYIFLADNWKDAIDTALIYSATTPHVDNLLKVELLNWED